MQRLLRGEGRIQKARQKKISGVYGSQLPLSCLNNARRQQRAKMLVVKVGQLPRFLSR